MESEQVKKPRTIKKVKEIPDLEEIVKVEVETVKVKKVGRFEKGSQEARDYMATLRSKKKINQV